MQVFELDLQCNRSEGRVSQELEEGGGVCTRGIVVGWVGGGWVAADTSNDSWVDEMRLHKQGRDSGDEKTCWEAWEGKI